MLYDLVQEVSLDEKKLRMPFSRLATKKFPLSRGHLLLVFSSVYVDGEGANVGIKHLNGREGSITQIGLRLMFGRA